MGLRYGVSQAESQTKSINAECDREIEAYEKTITALKKFNSDTELTGQTYQSAKKYCMSVIVPLAQGMIEVNEEIKRLNNKYKNKYRNEVATVSVDEDKLTGQINSIKRSISNTQEISKSVPVASPMLQNTINALGVMQRELQKKIERLNQFESGTSSGYSTVEKLISQVNSGLKQLETHQTFNSKAGTFSTDEMDMGIFVGLSNSYKDMRFCKKYDIQRPEGMTDKEFKEYVSTLRTQAKELKDDGWNRAAIKGYFSYVQQNIKNLNGSDVIKRVKELNESCYTVGSPAFLSLMNSAYPNTKEGQKKTLKMVYKVLGAVVDDNGFLQLTNMSFEGKGEGKYHFTEDIMEALKFDQQFSEVVQGAFPKGLPVPPKSSALTTGAAKIDSIYSLANQTHQFRYYLDYKNNIALRKTYPNAKNDLERLQMLQRDLLMNYKVSTPFFLAGEKARLHNKYQGNPKDYDEFIKKYGMNHKFVTSPKFHSEWIIDKNGNIVSQWNAYEFDGNGRVDSNPNKSYTIEQQRQIVDGNSVNYANNNKDKHIPFDSDPVSQYDPIVRKNVGKDWNNPSKKENREDYFDVDKSTAEANKLLKGE